MPEIHNKIVYFDQWCNKCKYYKSYDGDDPCNECLNEPVNEDSRKPVKFEPKDK